MVRGDNVTVKLFTTEGKDVITNLEQAASNQVGEDLVTDSSDNLNPPPGRFIKHTVTKHITIVADKPCIVEFTILFVG